MATRPSGPSRRRTGGSEDGAPDPALPQKKRARHRLIGAIALCVLAAIVVPMLLESEPTRPVSEVAIVVPSRDAVATARPADARQDPKADARSAAKTSNDPKGEAARGATVRGAIEPAAPSAEARAADPSDKAPAAKGAPDSKSADAKSADAKASKGGPPKDEIQQLAEAAQARAKAEASTRYLVQVGAFSTEAASKAAVDRVQAAGLTAFTERIKGERIRVRVGPFASREAAEEARGRLKSAGIDAAVIAP